MPTTRAPSSQLRRRLLDRLGEPASATRLAGELGLSRQRINYHLRALEQAGLIELVEERQRRGCVERVMRRRSATTDGRAAERLIVAAGDMVRDVSRMRAAAVHEGSRLLTFTIETEVAFAEPRDLDRFCDVLAAAVGDLAAAFSAPGAHSRRYRLVAAAYPAPDPAPDPDPATRGQADDGPDHR